MDLLLADVIMPKMNGLELARGLLARNPRMRTLFMSGYPTDVIDQKGVSAERLKLLQKPFGPTQLLARVAEALSNRSDRPTSAATPV